MAASMKKVCSRKILKAILKNNIDGRGASCIAPAIGLLESQKRFHTLLTQRLQREAAQHSFEPGVPASKLSQIESTLHNSLTEPDYFQLEDSINVNSLFKARAHLGHNAGLRHESTTPFIFGERLGQDIIDLEQTLPRLREALNVCAHIVYRGGMVLFLTRNQQILPWVERLAKETGEYSHCRVWKRGTFTNASHLFNTLPIYPELCIFLTTQDTVFEQHRAVVESSKLLIPSIGILDTNCNASHITYPVPGNDDTPSALHLYISLFRNAIVKAKEKRKTDGLDM